MTDLTVQASCIVGTGETRGRAGNTASGVEVKLSEAKQASGPLTDLTSSQDRVTLLTVSSVPGASRGTLETSCVRAKVAKGIN